PLTLILSPFGGEEIMRKSPLPFRGEGKGEGYAKIESQNAISVEGKTLIWTRVIGHVNLLGQNLTKF
ncbi:MAG: hypothetical protein NTY34_01690, partial [Candidatus Omnitrophica bacterium]|nr:hypothetical protein [Candidatus Omnitrophota bacterium]